MALTEPIHETVAENVLVALEEIDATPLPGAHSGDPDTPSLYYYGPSRAFRCDGYEARYFDNSGGTKEKPTRLLHMVRQDGPLTYFRLMNCEWECTREFNVLAALVDDTAEDLPWLVSSVGKPLPTTDQNRLLADMERALLPEGVLGLEAVDRVDFAGIEFALERTGWTLVEVRLHVIYRIPTPGTA